MYVKKTVFMSKVTFQDSLLCLELNVEAFGQAAVKEPSWYRSKGIRNNWSLMSVDKARLEVQFS